MSDELEKPCHQELPSVEGPMIHRFKQQADRIEKLEAALRNVAVTLDSEEIPYMVRNRYACATAKEALNDKPVYKEGDRAVEEAMGHPSPEFWIGDRND